jgi:hypothetical protein
VFDSVGSHLNGEGRSREAFFDRDIVADKIVCGAEELEEDTRVVTPVFSKILVNMVRVLGGDKDGFPKGESFEVVGAVHDDEDVRRDKRLLFSDGSMTLLLSIGDSDSKFSDSACTVLASQVRV